MSDLLRERRGSDGRQRERLRRESIAGQRALKKKEGKSELCLILICNVYQLVPTFDVSPLTVGSSLCFLSACLLSSSTTIWEKDGRTFTFIWQERKTNREKNDNGLKRSVKERCNNSVHSLPQIKKKPGVGCQKVDGYFLIYPSPFSDMQSLTFLASNI